MKASASSKELAKLGWKGGSGNLPSAYLTGVLAGRRALARGVEGAILDIGLRPSTKGSKLYAALKGLTDAGLEVPHSEGVLPSHERLSGSHIAAYAKTLLSEGGDAYRRRFSGYVGKGLKPEELSSHFEHVRVQIQSLKEEA